ncbi:hypothetical protein ACIPY0_12250 [Paenarthrobacter nicotinovorans]|uniref:hypothetical protein n=1 Tax=Paenarthrobacter nicotinovorans TaxID=29320 RepID=UPI0037FA6CFD
MSGYYGNFVVPDFLAEPADLAAWTGAAAPANATQLLRSATSRILTASRGSHYPVDADTGFSTDPVVAKALKDATCIQAAAWAAIKYDPAAGGVVTSTVAADKSIGSARIHYAGAQAAADSKQGAATGIVPEAAEKLAQYNLLASSIVVFG